MLQYKKGLCSSCGDNKLITNSKYKLCQECNSNRLSEKKPKKEVKPLKQVAVKKITSQESAFKKQLSEVKNQKREIHLTNGTYFCEGCGKAGEQLDCSHTISLRRKKELGLEIDNLRLLCRSCHDKWESRDVEKMKKLLCFEEDKVYILNQDSEWYYLLFG